jgi:hypothetical protein
VMDPDTKDWTWVLTRPCPECGFDASTCDALAVPGLIRANAADWQILLAGGRVKRGRANPAMWSSLEYACHVRDVYRIYHERIGAMLEVHDPLFANWDQNASAVEDEYDVQDPPTAVSALRSNVDSLANHLDGIFVDDWARQRRRSDGASFTVDTISRYMIRDPVHHLWDVSVVHA